MPFPNNETSSTRDVNPFQYTPWCYGPKHAPFRCNLPRRSMDGVQRNKQFIQFCSTFHKLRHLFSDTRVIYHDAAWMESKATKSLFSLAAEKFQHNQFTVQHNQIQIDNEITKQSDAWRMVNTTCTLFQKGVMILMSHANVYTYPTLHSLSSRVNVPFINWNLPPRLQTVSSNDITKGRRGRGKSRGRGKRAADIVVPLPSSPTGVGLANLDISIKIPLHKILGDIILLKGWHKRGSNVTYIYDLPEAIYNVERLATYLSVNRSRENALRYRRRHQTRSAPKNGLHFELRQLDLQRPVEFFKRLHNSRQYGLQRVILDITSVDTRNQRRILKTLAENSACCRNFHYLVASYSFPKEEYETFRRGLVNVTGFHILSPTNPVYKKFLDSQVDTVGNGIGSVTMDDVTPEAAFAYDSVAVAAKGIERILSQTDTAYTFDGYLRSGRIYINNRRGLDCKGNGFNESHGFMLAQNLKKVQLDGLSGRVQFDDDGFRTNFSVNINEILFSANTNVMHAVSTTTASRWSDSRGFIWDKSAGDGKKSSDSRLNKTWVVTTALNEPFVMLKKPKDNENLTGNAAFEGYCVDLIEKIAEVIEIENFRYEIRLVKDKKFGNVGEDGRWNGMLGELINGTSHLAVASLTITKARERVVDFSKPFMTLGISIMIKKPDKQEFSVFSFMSPLSNQIWMYIVFAYVGVSMVLFWVSRVSPYEWQMDETPTGGVSISNDFTVYNCLWFTLAAFMQQGSDILPSVVIFIVSRFSPYEWRIDETPTGAFTISNDFSVYNCLWFTLAAFMQQGTDILPRSISGRVASSAWWFFTMIIVSSYTANLAAFLTLEKMQTPIESVEDLARQTKIKYGIQGGGSTAEFFRESSLETYKKMWQFMSSTQPSVFVTSYAEGIKRVRESKGRYAFLLESSANNFINSRKPCDTMKVGQDLNSVGYGIATPFGSELKDKINLAILELQERGELKRLENKWWYDRGQCETGRSDGHSASLNLSKVAGIFYILIGGMVISMLCALGEFLYRSRIEAHKGQKGIPAALRGATDVNGATQNGSKSDSSQEKRNEFFPSDKDDMAVKSRLLSPPQNGAVDIGGSTVKHRNVGHREIPGTMDSSTSYNTAV